MCAVVLRGLISPNDSGSVTDKYRAYLGDTQELHRRRLPAAVCRQSHHVRLVDITFSVALTVPVDYPRRRILLAWFGLYTCMYVVRSSDTKCNNYFSRSIWRV